MAEELNHRPLAVAWKKYQEDGDVDRLLGIAREQQDQELAFRGILWQAVGAGDWPLIRNLEKENVSLPEEENFPLLHGILSEFGDVSEPIEWLVAHGASVNARDPNDWTPLHFACRAGYISAAKTLVRAGADMNLQTSIDGGLTPLMEACQGGRREVVTFLLSEGADQSITSTYGSARDFASKAGHNDIVEILDSWPSARKPKSRRWTNRNTRRKEKNKPGEGKLKKSCVPFYSPGVL